MALTNPSGPRPSAVSFSASTAVKIAVSAATTAAAKNASVIAN